MKKQCNSILSLSIIILFLMSGCDSFRKSAEQYLQSGDELFERRKYIQASLQYRNAIQINQDMTLAWYGLSLAEEKQQRLDKVYVLLNKVLELDPSHIEARIKRGKIFLQGKLLDKALDDSNVLLKLAPDNSAVRAFRAAVLLNLSDNQGAIKEANIALGKNPDNIDAMIVLATERLSSGDAITAISYLDKGIALNEKNLILQLIKIKALDAINKHDEVVAVFQRLIALYPEDNEFRLALAQYYIANNKIEYAEKVYKKAVEHNPDDIDIKIELVKFIFREQGSQQAITQLKSYINEDPEQYKLQFALADLFKIAQRFAEAENVYKIIINKNTGRPDGLSAQIKLAEIAFNQFRLDIARQFADKVLEKESTNSEALLLKASIELAEDYADKAIVDLRTVLKNEPDSVKALLLLARAHLKNNSMELAKNNYRRAVKLEPVNQQVALEYANFLIKNTELNSAEAVIVSLLERIPDSLPGLQLLADLKLKKGDWEGAHELAEQIKTYGGKEVVTEQILGAVFRGKQEYQQSIEAFKRAHKASPSSVQPIVALVRSYVKVGKISEASYFLNSVLEAHPSNFYALILMGQRYMLDNNLQQAELYYKRAIKTNLKDAMGYLQLAKLYVKQKRYRDALDVIDSGLGKLPENVLLMLSKARVQDQSGRFDLAITLYEQILAKNHNIDLAANNLASLYTDHYSTDKKKLNRALDLTVDFDKSVNPYFRDTLGWVYYRLGHYAKATRLFMSATKAIPEVPVFHYHLGMSLRAEGKNMKAKASLQTALSLSGNDLSDMKDINEVLKEL